MTKELKTKIQNLIEEKHFEEAIKLCDEAIEKDDKDEYAYFLKSNCYFELEDYDIAIENLNKVTDLNPNNGNAYFSKGFFYSILKKYEKSIENYSKSIELNPNNENGYISRGFIKSNLKMYEESIEDYNKSIELNSNNEIAFISRGFSKLNLKMYEEAIKDFNKVIELNPEEQSAYLNIGVLKSNLKLYEESIKDFNKVIELNHKDEKGYFNRGLSKLNLKMYEKAINDFDQVIELNNKNEYAYLLIVFAQINLKKYIESINYIDKAIELNNNRYWYYLRFLSKINLYEYNEAINAINNFIQLDKRHLKIPCIILIFQALEKYYNVDKLFILLTDINNNNLWENEPITNLISRFDESKKFDDKLKENIKYLLLYEYFLLKILTFDTEEEDNIEISHYTSLDILPLLLNVKGNTKESGNIRINNITTANDPKEGKVLERILNKNNINIKIGNDEKALTLQTSYSRNKDSLTMFRLYGKKENKEATGICLVLDNKYFNNSYTSPYSYEYESKINYEIIKELRSSIKVDENKTINDIDNEEIVFIQKRNLYWVLYYNEKENQLIYNKEKSKYASNIIDLNDLNSPNYKAELKEDDKKEDMIKYAFAKIFHYTKEIKKQIEGSEIYKNIKNQLYSYLFENIKYIIKHEAFFEEQELRMLVTNDYKSDEISIDNDNKKLYIDYIKLFDENNNYIKEIIIGSKVENNEAVAEYIRKVLHSKNTEMNKLDDIKVSISEAPLR
ncbi:hypothetical protein BRSU_2663 [Brachyspira suanatina]|uniref:Uncharacterized protein n=1 Tax=Brachyspira suanatina TaxID=381802 RepID=A0A0G4KAN1_9SPIR|nr:tetratricopeptide repeat protein [Brachyspira suanatina]CRF35450.1 hypothetical protein BRSU_2663 [Brachyspira suanatina]